MRRAARPRDNRGKPLRTEPDNPHAGRQIQPGEELLSDRHAMIHGTSQKASVSLASPISGFKNGPTDAFPWIKVGC